jgi:hypothetical protein
VTPEPRCELRRLDRRTADVQARDDSDDPHRPGLYHAISVAPGDPQPVNW